MQARLDLLRDRLQDQRSGKVLVLSHCLLNQNVRYLGGAVHPGMVDEALEEARRHGYGLYQLPCPEQRAWGGVLKRSLVPAYAAEGTLRYRLRRPLLWLFTRSTSLRYRLLARRAASDVRDYLRSGFKVTGIVGVAGSPSCGVRRTLNLSGAQVRTYRARAATAAELERYWPQLLRVWPAYERFYRQGGRRSVFVLDPTSAVEPQPAEPITP